MTKWVSISDIADREALRHHAEQAAADIAALQAENEQLRVKLADAGLTLITLCDMVLGEDAEDRSDDALIRAVGRLRTDNARLLGENQELRRENTGLRGKVRDLRDTLAEEVRQARLNAFQERQAAFQARREAERLREELARGGNVVHIDGVDYGGLPATVVKRLRELEAEAAEWKRSYTKLVDYLEGAGDGR